jgi:hypothetical protein
MSTNVTFRIIADAAERRVREIIVVGRIVTNWQVVDNADILPRSHMIVGRVVSSCSLAKRGVR